MGVAIVPLTEEKDFSEFTEGKSYSNEIIYMYKGMPSDNKMIIYPVILEDMEDEKEASIQFMQYLEVTDAYVSVTDEDMNDLLWEAYVEYHEGDH